MKYRNQIEEMVIISLAMFGAAAAIFFFLIPSHAVVGSVSGLAIVLGNLIPLQISTITMVLNVVLIVLGFLFIGKEFGAKTVYASLILPLMLRILECLFPEFDSITKDPSLDMVCYIFVSSLCQAIIFSRNASSGGLDVVAKLFNKYMHIEIGKTISLVGMCIACSSILFCDMKCSLLSILGTYINGMVLDYFILSINTKKRVCIISEKEPLIREFILHQLHSGATIYEAVGAYEMQKHREIITIVDKKEYGKLMSYLEKIDDCAFVTVYTVNEIKYVPKESASC